jgi:aryl-alcohol dehydrogenase-like predicted oxidoreductase
LSEASASTLRRAVAVHPVAAHQIEYSAFTLNPAEELLSVHRELGITTVAYSPIGRGFLTGQVKSMNDLQGFNKMVSRNNEENFKKILELVAKFEDVAKSHGAKPSQVAIAWLLAQGEDIIPIPGTKSAKYMEENSKASDVKLTKEEVQSLRAAAEATVLEGSRYPDMMQFTSDTPALES